MSAQHHWSLLTRDIEDNGVLQCCRERNIALLVYRSLESGLLTGKYRQGAPMPAGSRLEDDDHRLRWMTPRNVALVDALRRNADEWGLTLLEVALGWLSAKPEVGSVIVGATGPDQVRRNAVAVGTRLSSEQVRTVDELTSDL